MTVLYAAMVLAAEAAEEDQSSALFPKAQELIWGALAFGVLFFFMVKWVFPRINESLEARRQKIQGDLERAEGAKGEAERLLAEYRERLAGAREESNRIIEEARQTADQLRRDLQAKAEKEAQATVARAQEEIRAERDRVFQELKARVGALSVQLAERVVGASLDSKRHQQMIDDYIEQLAGAGNGKSGRGSGDG